ncbi:putative S-adenosyl-L-methionine-dependent methyltransferase-domain-containing protein [Boeremia exigua]|uniref:putative S-adenosyl-L-methionine-dependent methyltransferase-domain-containing protein n=1 Tax=Boeremia exigua TaxID=749465 RepID=UPI001E8E2C32|nr:putative S-adenosyl-L-methionine-dependent methyltransferase-domain-containing protein [Boeremia exigua]KAH6616671.1 putative S-adenosyl-L-methionine-dependent methyltransferase-domain-containing protein [Boeremia exigua]
MRAYPRSLFRTAKQCSRARPQLLTSWSACHGLRLSSTSAPSSPPTPTASPAAPKEGERKWSTPLAQFLGQAITTTGPISVAAYMRQCLTSELGGYYTRTPTAGEDQFGTKGDFVTSPEISQVFGELIGIWLYAEWLAQGRKERVQIIEVGPGRGTLMDDVLRTLSSFKRMTSAIETIYLIEASPHLQKQQALRLAGTEELEKSEVGWKAKCKYFPDCDIQWCEDIRVVPKGETSTPFILAHEFFDALPIHVFQNVAQSSIPKSSTIMTPTGPITPKHGPMAPGNQWHELVVSPTNPYASTTTLKPGEEKPDFEMTVSKSPTPHSLYLPKMSGRYKKLEKSVDAIIEISPESLSYIADFAARIGGSEGAASRPPQPGKTPVKPVSSQDAPFKKAAPSGAALILDYGTTDTIPANTLRGIRQHTAVSPFIAPGHVDLSADVDFLALAEAALDASDGVEVHGPVDQSFFLSTMGIKERAERLLKHAKDEETRKRLEIGWKRLIDRGPNGMGKLYKAMAILPYAEGKKVRRPVGFGGDIMG